MSWYLLRFKATSFNVVFNHLAASGVYYFCPMIETQYRRPDSIASFRKRLSPVFPGYLFVNLDFDHCHPQKLSAHRHIYGLINFGQGPSPIDDAVIDLLMAKPHIVREIVDVPRGWKEMSELEKIMYIRDDEQRIAAFLNYMQSRHSSVVA
ncbi:transcription termination/antitermination NusG family protein [Sodalis endosymbiont of Spalangia cameroni]|uniref:transcription termination/antitermination NusG family protein n=1 Tax=Sodalis praecaptivus TaxID=1239307 RepID=UPI0031F81AE2